MVNTYRLKQQQKDFETMDKFFKVLSFFIVIICITDLIIH